MKQILIIMMSIMCGFGFSQSRYLGNKCFVNGEGTINIAINAKVATMFLDKEFLPIIVYINTDKGISAKIQRSDIHLEVNGKDFQLADYESYCKEYSNDDKSLEVLRYGLNKDFCVTAKEFLSVNSDNWATYPLFPIQKKKYIKVDEIGVNYSIGGVSRLYFKNPGLKKGDLVTIKVQTESGEKGQVSFEI